ncbi:MAG: hypothetical protein ACE5GW_11355, partial [Planctomycetota bacterium]
LELPLDSFLSHPRACSPVLLPAAAGAENTGRARIRYRVPEKKMLVVGIGALTISYWQCKVLRPTWGTVTIDKARGVPIEEELIDASEKTVARIEYQEYLAAGDGALAPSRIRVEVFDGLVGSKQRHMIYEARFRLADGVWILDGAEGSEVTEKGPERRALASVQAVRVVRAEKPTSRPRKE